VKIGRIHAKAFFHCWISAAQFSRDQTFGHSCLLFCGIACSCLLYAGWGGGGWGRRIVFHSSGSVHGDSMPAETITKTMTFGLGEIKSYAPRAGQSHPARMVRLEETKVEKIPRELLTPIIWFVVVLCILKITILLFR